MARYAGDDAGAGPTGRGVPGARRAALVVAAVAIGATIGVVLGAHDPASTTALLASLPAPVPAAGNGRTTAPGDGAASVGHSSTAARVVGAAFVGDPSTAPRAVGAEAMSPARPARVLLVPPPAFAVGDVADLVVSIDAPRDARAVAFTIVVDPDVVQVRAVREGSWTTDAGGHAAFTSELAASDDRVRIAASLDRARGDERQASVAVIQVQGMAPGSAAPALVAVDVRDGDGRPLRTSLAPGVPPSLRVVSRAPPTVAPVPGTPSPAPLAAPAATTGLDPPGD